MNKQMMLLALAAVSASFFALPAVASANWGIDPTTQSFNGTSDETFVGSFSASGEPKFTCEGPNPVSGAWIHGTEGSITLHLTTCHASVIFTIPCKTAGAPLSNTIHAVGTFKNVTIAADASGRKRGITVTPAETTIECAGISSTKVAGKVIGRITNDPAPSLSGCGVVDSSVTLEFLLSGGVQTPLRTDSMSISESDDLTSQTGSEVPKTAGLEDKFVLSTASATTWTCNAS
jgi:hypothetical protein